MLQGPHDVLPNRHGSHLTAPQLRGSRKSSTPYLFYSAEASFQSHHPKPRTRNRYFLKPRGESYHLLFYPTLCGNLMFRASCPPRKWQSPEPSHPTSGKAQMSPATPQSGFFPCFGTREVQKTRKAIRATFPDGPSITPCSNG